MKFVVWKVGASSLTVLGALLFTGCAASQVSSRIVEEPAGTAMSYGAPTDVGFEVETWASREVVSAIVYRKATCAAQPVQIVHRVRETLKDDVVMERKTMSRKQVAEGKASDVPCDVGYARDVEVYLAHGSEKFLAGTTDERGRVSVNLAELLKVAVYDDVPKTLSLEIRPAQAKPLRAVGELSLAHFDQQREKVDSLKDSLRSALSGELKEPSEVLVAYEALSALSVVAPYDADLSALSDRFYEVNQTRKREVSRSELSKNLKALGEARETLKVMGDAALPLYVQVAVSSGVLDRQALQWSSLRLLRALKQSGQDCVSDYAWRGVPMDAWDPEARLAAHYMSFAGGVGREQSITRVCRSWGK